MARPRQCDVCGQEEEDTFGPALRLRGVGLHLNTCSQNPAAPNEEICFTAEVCDRCFGMVEQIKDAARTIIASYGPDAAMPPTARVVSLRPRGFLGWLMRGLCGG